SGNPHSHAAQVDVHGRAVEFLDACPVEQWKTPPKLSVPVSFHDKRGRDRGNFREAGLEYRQTCGLVDRVAGEDNQIRMFGRDDLWEALLEPRPWIAVKIRDVDDPDGSCAFRELRAAYAHAGDSQPIWFNEPVGDAQ